MATYNYKMKSIVCLFLLVFLQLTTTIYLPLVPKRPRCMMVFTIGEVESVKFDITLPALPSQGSDEDYLLTLRNTETEQSTAESIPSGIYKRERELTPSTSLHTQMSSTSSASSSTQGVLSITSVSTITQKLSFISITPK